MSNTSTARTSRPGRDKPSKSQLLNGKDGPVGKNQANKPTPEQMRTAQLVDRKPEDTEYNRKVSQIMELTKKSEEEVIVALYDCDQDTNRTVNLLLEGGGDQGEWQEMGKKRKKNTSQPVQNKVEMNDRSDRKSNKENVGDKGDEREPYERGEQRDRSESSGRNRRIMNDGPPRFQKAGKVWRGSQENNDRSGRGDRGGNFERGRGRGRGGRSGSRGGRGGSFSGGFGGGGFRNNSEPIDDWGDSGGEPKTNGFESSPPIDTWTNDQAAKKQNSWGETEDWNDDDWTGPLTETTVFTARNLTPSTPGKDQNDQKPDTDDGFIQSNSLPQPIDLNALLNQRPSEKMDLHAQSNQATESLKSMMGIGTSAPSNYSSVTSMPLTSGSDSSSSLAVGTMSQAMLNQTSMPLQSQRAKPMRSKLPPPSKIPNTPVEMPGSAMSMRLDVQFGFGADPGGLNDVDKSIASSFANSSVGPMSSLSRNGPSADGSSSVPSLSSMVQPKAPPSMSSIDSATPQRQSMFQNSPDTTPSKDYQHQAHLNKALMTPPESYSNQDRQSSPRIPAHSQSNMDNDPKYSQNSYSSYQRFQPKVGVESDSSKSSYSKPQSQYQSGFQPSNSFQNQSTSNYSKLGQFSQTSSSSYRGQSGSLDHQQDTSPPGYSSGQAGSAYAQKQAQNNSYQSGKLTSYTQPSLSGQPTATYSSKSSSDDYTKPQSSSSTPYSAPQNYSGQSSTRQSDESFSSNQSASSSYNSGSQTTSNYHSSTGTGFESAAVSASSLSSGQTQTSSQSVQYGARTSAYGGSSTNSSALQTSPISANKLSDGLSKMTVDDTANLKSGASYSDADVSTTSSSLTSQPSAATSSTSSSQLGLSSAAVSSTSSLHSTTSTSTRASSNMSASKAPPNLPPGVPTVMGPNFIVGQPGMQYFNLQGLQQPQVYSYEELQMLQQRLMPGYYDPSTALPFQQTPTSLAGARADQNSIVSNMPQYSPQSSDPKMNRVDAPSPVQGSQSGQQQQPPQSAHQQQFINALAPGYGYYAYPNAGILPGGPYSYQPTMFQQVPPVTNTAHAPSSSSSQYQKPYSSHAYGGYDDMNQGQDFGKSGGYHMSQGSTKVTGNTGMKTITTSSSDLGNLSYGKSHSQGYDKGYHHGSTPPPYGIPAGVSSQQTNPMAAQTGYAPFLPMMSHQHAGQMMAHPHVQVRQDQTGLRPGGQPTSAGAKPASAMNKYANTYWNAA